MFPEHKKNFIARKVGSVGRKNYFFWKKFLFRFSCPCRQITTLLEVNRVLWVDLCNQFCVRTTTNTFFLHSKISWKYNVTKKFLFRFSCPCRQITTLLRVNRVLWVDFCNQFYVRTSTNTFFLHSKISWKYHVTKKFLFRFSCPP